VYVDDDVDEYVDVDEDADVDVLDNKTGRRRQEEEDACAREECTFMNNFVDKSVDNCVDKIVRSYDKTTFS
ncbi:MAG: hypothetical protein J6J59_01030, partial [Peptococcaceae bacterium]|nr:hypothetical protein [Peptococcaceae bacterium]